MSGFYLKNRLLEVLVVIGADDSSGLRRRPGSGGGGGGLNQQLTSQAYEPCFLATVNESKAAFPTKHPPVAPFYPLPAFHAGSRASQSLGKQPGRLPALLVTADHQQQRQNSMIEEEEADDDSKDADEEVERVVSSSGGSGRRRLGVVDGVGDIIRSLTTSSPSSPRSSTVGITRSMMGGGARRPSAVRPTADMVKTLMSDEDQLTLSRVMRPRRPTIASGVDGRRMSSVRNIAVSQQEKKLSGEVLEGLPELCYPEGLQISSRPVEARIDYHVLTHISGDRLYATLLTFGRQYRALRQFQAGGDDDEEDDGSVQLRIDEDCKDEERHSGSLYYVPTTVILVSKLPYFTVMKTALSSLLSRVRQEDPHSFDTEVMSATIALCSTPVPPYADACIGVRAELFGVTLSVLPPLPLLGIVVDFDVTVLFRSLSLDDILLLLSSLLTDQRIVVTSSDASLIALVMESLLLLLHPMRWNLPYMSNIPSVEFLGAPQPFFFGCHSSYKAEVDETPGLVVGDLDTGKVYMTEPAEFLPSMPKDLSRQLKSQLAPRLKKLNFDWVLLSRPDALTIEEFHDQKTRFNVENRHILLGAFLQYMVELFGSVKQFITVDAERRFFNKDGYLNSLPESDRVFYEMAARGTMFDAFLRDRLDRQSAPGVDAWDRLAGAIFSRKTSVTARGRSRQSASLLPLPRIPELEPAQKQPEYLRLPEYFPREGSSMGFYQRCVEMLGQELEGADRSRRAVIHHLRAMYHLATGQNVPALRDCHQCYRCDIGLTSVGQAAVREILRGLADAERQALREELGQLRQLLHSTLPGGGGDFDIIDEAATEAATAAAAAAAAFAASTDAAETDASDAVDACSDDGDVGGDGGGHRLSVQLPTHSVNRDSFAECLANLGISYDEELHHRLFYTLLPLCLDYGGGLDVGMPAEECTVDPGVFGAFNEMWSSRVRELIAVDAPDDEAVVLKAGSFVHVDKLGSGHLILTDRRLYLRSPQGHGGSPYRCLAELDRVTKVERPRLFWRIPSGFAALRVTFDGGGGDNGDTDGGSHTVWLKGGLTAWFTVLEELLAAIDAHRSTKDRTVLHKASENALIIDTLLALAAVEGSPFHRAEKQLMDNFLYFSRDRFDCQLPESTRASLMLKFNPAFGESKKVSIMGLFPMGPPGEYQFPEPVYCAFHANSVSKLAIVDMQACQIDCIVASLPGRITCLLQESRQPAHFWLATFDQSGSLLTVVNGQKRRAEEKLVGHRGPVQSLLELGERLYSVGSEEGEILVWQTAQRRLLSRIGCGPGVQPTCLCAAEPGPDEGRGVSQLLFCSRSAIYQLSTAASAAAKLLTSLEAGFKCDRLLTLADTCGGPGGAAARLLVASSDRACELRFFRRHGDDALTPAGRLRLRCPSKSGSCRGIGSICQLPAAAAAQDQEKQQQQQHLLLVGCKEGFIFVVDFSAAAAAAAGAEPLAERLVLQAHTDVVQCLTAVSPHGRLFLSGSRSHDGYIAVWDSQAMLDRLRQADQRQRKP